PSAGRTSTRTTSNRWYCVRGAPVGWSPVRRSAIDLRIGAFSVASCVRRSAVGMLVLTSAVDVKASVAAHEDGIASLDVPLRFSVETEKIDSLTDRGVVDTELQISRHPAQLIFEFVEILSEFLE